MRSRPLLGLALLLSAALSSAGFTLWRVIWHPPDSEPAAAQVFYDRERFASVKPLLPASGVIGYREDDPPGSPTWQTIHFAQYVLAPVVLSEEADGPFVLVNGRPEELVTPQVKGRPLLLLHDAGNGVRLFGTGEP
jgi:hypothetical protein